MVTFTMCATPVSLILHAEVQDVPSAKAKHNISCTKVSKIFHSDSIFAKKLFFLCYILLKNKCFNYTSLQLYNLTRPKCIMFVCPCIERLALDYIPMGNFPVLMFLSVEVT